jgi:hypothetical protein
MKYCRINLSKTNYSELENIVIFVNAPVTKLKNIFKKYCTHKNFEGVMPLFDSQFTDPNNDVWGYLDHNNNLVAFSLVRKYDNDNVESLQFAWDYVDQKLRLGIRSIEHECAVYKKLGYKYLYLGISEEYKKSFFGYEEVGPDNV